MKIVAHDELTSELEVSIQELRLSVGWVPRDFRRIEDARKSGYPAPDYFGLYAVEGRRVVSTARVLRIPYTFPDGHIETVSGVLSVITRREHRGHGLARKLITEIQAREKTAGSNYSLLWTGLSIPAHHLYHDMGYGDVYTTDFALKKSAERKGVGGPLEVVPVKSRDAAKLELLHSVATRGRLGFTPRPKRLLRSLLKLGSSRVETLRLVVSQGRPVGYLDLEEGATWVKVLEVVTDGSVPLSHVLTTLERLSAGRWLSVWNTFVRDSGEALRARGYVRGLGDHVLMALPMGGSGQSGPHALLGADDPRFTCQVLDNF